MPQDPPSSSALNVLSSFGGEGVASLGSGLLGMHNSGDLFASVLTSNRVKDRIIDHYDLKSLNHTKYYIVARKRLSAETAISIDRKSGILTIEVTEEDPRRAADIANAYIAELNATLTQLDTSAAARERVFLEGRIKGVNQDLESAEAKMSQFSSKSSAIDINEQGKALVNTLATLQGEVVLAEADLKSASELYGNDNNRVLQIRARISELNHQLAKLEGNAPRAQADAEKPSNSAFPTLRQLPSLGTTYADLYREVKIQDAVLETLTRQYEMAKAEEAREAPVVRVLDPATAPERPSGPPRILILLGGALFSLIASICWKLGTMLWRRLPEDEPLKILAKEIAAAILPV